MPQVRFYKGRKIKRTKRMLKDGNVYVKVVYFGDKKNMPGEQELVSEADYRQNSQMKYYDRSTMTKEQQPVVA